MRSQCHHDQGANILQAMLYAAGVPNREMMKNAPHVGIATVWYVPDSSVMAHVSRSKPIIRLEISILTILLGGKEIHASEFSNSGDNEVVHTDMSDTVCTVSSTTSINDKAYH